MGWEEHQCEQDRLQAGEKILQYLRTLPDADYIIEHPSEVEGGIKKAGAYIISTVNLQLSNETPNLDRVPACASIKDIDRSNGFLTQSIIEALIGYGKVRANLDKYKELTQKPDSHEDIQDFLRRLNNDSIVKVHEQSFIDFVERTPEEIILNAIDTTKKNPEIVHQFERSLGLAGSIPALSKVALDYAEELFNERRGGLFPGKVLAAHVVAGVVPQQVAQKIHKMAVNAEKNKKQVNELDLDDRDVGRAISSLAAESYGAQRNRAWQLLDAAIAESKGRTGSSRG